MKLWTKKPKFKHEIFVNVLQLGTWETLYEWCKETFGSEWSRRNPDGVWMYKPNLLAANYARFYFRDDEQLIAFKLVWHKYF